MVSPAPNATGVPGQTQPDHAVTLYSKRSASPALTGPTKGPSTLATKVLYTLYRRAPVWPTPAVALRVMLVVKPAGIVVPVLKSWV